MHPDFLPQLFVVDDLIGVVHLVGRVVETNPVSVMPGCSSRKVAGKRSVVRNVMLGLTLLQHVVESALLRGVEDFRL